MAASAPPATITSASPYSMMRPDSPMQCVAVVQAVTMARLGPLKPNWIDRLPEIMLMIEPGMKNGETLRGPPSTSTLCVSSISGRPPMPAPMLTPTRVGSASGVSNPASLTASIPAARPKWMNVSIRRTSLGGMNWVGSNPLTSPAIWQDIAEASKRVIRVMPERPAQIEAQFSAVLLPIGETIPMPVTTTRRRDTRFSGGETGRR